MSSNGRFVPTLEDQLRWSVELAQRPPGAGVMFRKAVKSNSRLRLALVGPAGSGKTYQALAIAAELAKSTGRRTAVIDTENGSASKYSDVYDFDVVELSSFDTTTYIEAIEAAGEGGYGQLVIDSASHAWDGPGGLLEQKDRAGRSSANTNQWAAWGAVTPKYNRFIQVQQQSPCHLIVTLRSKTEWILDERNKPRPVGLGAVQRPGYEYEYDVVGQLSRDHVLTIEKTRFESIDGREYIKNASKLARDLLSSLAASPVPAALSIGEMKREAAAIDTGGHPVGTVAAASYVADRRVAEITERRSFRDRALERMTQLRESVGESEFQRVLHAHGYDDPRRIRTQSDAKRIIALLERIDGQRGEEGSIQ